MNINQHSFLKITIENKHIENENLLSSDFQITPYIIWTLE